MDNKEIRSFNHGLEIRTAADGRRSVEGYLAVFGQRSVDLGGFTEVVQRGAFAASLTANPDVRLLVNHDWSKPLARTTAGTLTVREDSHGLAFRASMPDTSYARDLAESIERGDVSGCSFGFVTDEDAWDDTADGVVRTLRAVTLSEGSIVTNPAYPQTAVDLRSLPDSLRGLVRVPGHSTLSTGLDADALTRVLLARRKTF